MGVWYKLKALKVKIYSDETMELLSTVIPLVFGSMNSLILHTILFLTSYFLILFGFNSDYIFALVTNLVSLEAIYLSIFLLMSSNLQLKKLHAVAEDVKEIQTDVDEIQVDVDEIQTDIDEIQEDVKEIQEDQEDDDDDKILENIDKTMKLLIKEISDLKNNRNKVRK